MRSFYNDVREKSGLWIVVFLLAVLSHGTMLLGRSIGIDTEDLIALQEAFYGEWLSMGRQGLVLLKLLFGTGIFNPQLAGVMTLLFLVVACMLWTSLFSCVSGKDSQAAVFVFSGLLLVSPLITEQMYFKLQSMEVAFGFCLMAVSLLLVYWSTTTKNHKQKYLFFCGSVLFNVVLFSLYQVMVPLFLFGASACFFLYCFFRKDASVREMKKLGILYLAVFLIGFICNQILTMVCFSAGADYLTGQVRWFTQSFKDCLINIYWHVKAVLLGQGMYYSKFYPVGCLFLIGIVLYNGRDKKRKAAFIGTVISLLMTIASPFYMTILCAVEPVRRSQLVMPFALAFVAYVLILCTDPCIGDMPLAWRTGRAASREDKASLLDYTDPCIGTMPLTWRMGRAASREDETSLLDYTDPCIGDMPRTSRTASMGKIRYIVLLVLCVTTGYVQLSGTMRLNYTDSVRYESDVRTAQAIMEDLDKLGDDAHAYPIIFVGKRAAELNNSCVMGDTIGYSFFEWDTDVAPQGFYNTRRIIHFFHVLGGDYHRGNEAQALKAAEYSKSMNSWPMEGSIVLHDDCIIVKLSD